MANDCLVTKLKGVVNNDSLVKLGCINTTRIAPVETISEGFSVTIIYDSNHAYSDVPYVKNLDGNSFRAWGSYEPYGDTAYMDQNSKTIYAIVDYQGGVLEISDKYYIKSLTLTGVLASVSDDTMLKAMSSLETLKVISLDLSCISSLTNLSVVEVNTPNGDIASLSGLTNLTRLFLSGAGVTGNLRSLGLLTNLTYMSLNETLIEGTIEEFVSLQRSAGRTTGSIEIPYTNWSTLITYQGNPLPFNITNLSWDAQGNITITTA